MRFNDDHKIIAIAERSAGNDSVGSMWLESKIFQDTCRIYDVINWAEKIGCDGKLILTVADDRDY